MFQHVDNPSLLWQNPIFKLGRGLHTDLKKREKLSFFYYESPFLKKKIVSAFRLKRDCGHASCIMQKRGNFVCKAQCASCLLIGRLTQYLCIAKYPDFKKSALKLFPSCYYLTRDSYFTGFQVHLGHLSTWFSTPSVSNLQTKSYIEISFICLRAVFF